MQEKLKYALTHLFLAALLIVTHLSFISHFSFIFRISLFLLKVRIKIVMGAMMMKTMTKEE